MNIFSLLFFFSFFRIKYITTNPKIIYKKIYFIFFFWIWLIFIIVIIYNSIYDWSTKTLIIRGFTFIVIITIIIICFWKCIFCVFYVIDIRFFFTFLWCFTFFTIMYNFFYIKDYIVIWNIITIIIIFIFWFFIWFIFFTIFSWTIFFTASLIFFIVLTVVRFFFFWFLDFTVIITIFTYVIVWDIFKWFNIGRFIFNLWWFFWFIFFIYFIIYCGMDIGCWIIWINIYFWFFVNIITFAANY